MAFHTSGDEYDDQKTASGMVFVTGLETDGNIEDEIGDDLTNYVLASCM